MTPTTYLGMAIALGLMALVCWCAFYIYFKRHPDKFKGLNVAVAVLILGPLLPVIRSSLAKRGGQMTNRELWGLLAMVSLMIAAIAISLIFGVGIRGR